MPLKRGVDQYGSYYKYGSTGKKYYYLVHSKHSRKIAYNKAKRQGVAIRINKK